MRGQHFCRTCMSQCGMRGRIDLFVDSAGSLLDRGIGI